MENQEVKNGEDKIAEMENPGVQRQDKVPGQAESAKDRAEKYVIARAENGLPKMIVMCSILTQIKKILAEEKGSKCRLRGYKE